MKASLILAVVTLIGSMAEAKQVQQKIEKPNAQVKNFSSNLDGTVVMRRNKLTGEVTKVHVKDVLPSTKEAAAKLSFEQIAVDSESPGTKIDPADILDQRGSTSASRFGYYGGRYWRPGYLGGYGGRWGYGYGRYAYGAPYYRYGYGTGYGYYGYRSPYYYNSYYGETNCNYYSNGYCNYYYPTTYRWAYPTYCSYGVGYCYNYAPYYGYSDDTYDYAYCGWRGGGYYY